MDGRFASILAVMLLAGCASSGAHSDQAGAQTAIDPGLGTVTGIVTDDSLNVLANATVNVSTVQTSTNPEGRFTISRLQPGPHRIDVTKPGFANTSTAIDVQAGQVVTLEFVLLPVPAGGAYHVTQIKKGTIFCGTAWRHPKVSTPVGGTSGGAFAACGAFYGTPLNNTDSFVVEFRTTQDVALVKSFVFETEWQASQTFGKGLSLLWEVHQDLVAYTFTELLRNFTHVEGVSPFHKEVNESTIKKNVTERKDKDGKLAKYCHPGEACLFWGRMFPFASTFGASSPVDFAFYLDQRYTHYVTEFYGLENPPGFTLLRDK
jgi:hypothetical protein